MSDSRNLSKVVPPCTNIITKNNSLVLGKGTISGIDLAKFSPNGEVREELRKSLHYEENDIVFMFLGRLNEDKGIFDLVKAFDQLTEVYSNVKLLIVGPDEENVTEQLNQQSSQNEKNIQERYKYFFAGIMKGIRGPFSHNNFIVDENTAGTTQEC